jgi:nucleotide-binding universal stress UspA family protein
MKATMTHAPGATATACSAVEAPFASALRGPVLLATDAEGASGAPAVAARLLADRLAQPLHVVSVIDSPPVYTTAPDVALMVPSLTRERRAAAEGAVRRKLERAMEPGRAWALHLVDGSPAREICRTAREIDASIIVLGAGSRRRGRRVVSGALAAEVLRRAPCAVLSVAPGFTALPRRIVAAMDFSPASIHAVQTALLLADEHATVTLVHVQPLFPIPYEIHDAAGTLLDGDVTPLLERVRDGFQASVSSPVTIATRIESGDIAAQVVSVAEELAADLVTVGTHGPGRAERFFVGSVAARVLHRAGCTVLATPIPPTAERARLELWMTGTVVFKEPAQWPAILDALSTRNLGRRLTVELDDPAIGAQMSASGYVLRGVVYDPHDRRAEVMLGSALSGTAHITHSIGQVTSLAIAAAHDGRDRALEVRHKGGHTLVLFDD